MPALTRGPLPARVYWVRRLVVLGVATVLVVGIARLLGGGSDGSSSPDQAAQVAADTTSTTSTTSTAPTAFATSPSATGWSDLTPSTADERASGTASRSSEPALAAPDGPCADEDVAVTPEVEDAVAGRDVTIGLQLRTSQSEACTWEVSPQTLTVAITSGKDDIWSSRDCPRAIPTRDVVVRRAVSTTVDLVWNAHRSDDDCSRFADWADLGWYHVTAAAVGGEPSDLQFELTKPSPVTITKTAEPTQSPSGRPVAPSRSPSKSPSTSPGKSPSGSAGTRG